MREAVLAGHAAGDPRVPHVDADHGIPCLNGSPLEPIGEHIRIAPFARACMD